MNNNQTIDIVSTEAISIPTKTGSRSVKYMFELTSVNLDYRRDVASMTYTVNEIDQSTNDVRYVDQHQDEINEISSSMSTISEQSINNKVLEMFKVFCTEQSLYGFTSFEDYVKPVIDDEAV